MVDQLRQIEVAAANGVTAPQACNEAASAEQTYFRWRRGMATCR